MRHQRSRLRIPYATEAEFCQAVLSSLRNWGEVYPEIVGVDYVLREGDQIYAIEAKLELNIKVIHQAWTRKETGQFDGAYVLIPRWTPAHECEPFYAEIIEKLGLGLLIWYEQAGRLCRARLPQTGPRKNERVFDLLHPEALEHTVAGRPSASQWNEWDVLEMKYVEWLHGSMRESPYLRYTQRKFDLNAAIRDVEPEFVGARGGVLQKGRDRVMSLILQKRWTKFKASHGEIWLPEWETMTADQWDEYFAKD